MKIAPMFKSPVFLGVLVLKIILSFLFAGELMVKGTIPFVSYFVETGSNPYDFFAGLNNFTGFPYPSMMLIVLVPFRFMAGWFINTPWNLVTPFLLFITRLPILLADITIFYVLTQLLKSRQKLVLLLYWCSPIIIYINYFHGQLDAIPIAFLFLSLYFVYKNQLVPSAIFLGLGIASKNNLILVAPFFVVYLWKQRIPFRRIVGISSIVVGSYVLPLLPFLSKSFFKTVFLAKEQFDLFNVAFNLGFLNVKIFAIPLILLLTFLTFMTYRSVNKELYFMMIAFTFSTLLIFTSPRPGWYYWTVPFIVFFLIREGKRSHFLVYGLFNLFYLLYFLFYQQSDIFQSFRFLSAKIAALPPPFFLLQKMGIDATRISSLFVTLLTATLIILVYWIYKLGIQINLKYNLVENPFTVGICGDSGSGKTTLTGLLADLTSNSNLAVISGDDVHKWERGDPNWLEKTHLNPEANKLFVNVRHAKNLRGGNFVNRSHYDHKTGRFTQARRIYPKRFVVFEGLHQFLIPSMRTLYDLKIFLNVDESLRKHWKIARDMKKRNYSKQKILAQLKRREKDSSTFIRPQARFSDIIISYKPLKKITKITEIGDVSQPRFLVQFKSKIHIDLDALGEELMDIDSIKFKSHFDSRLETQVCEFHGDISANTVEEIASKMVPEQQNLLNNFKPTWEGGLNGIIQLLMLMYIDEVLTLKVVQRK